MSQGRVLQFLKEGTAIRHEAVERMVDLPNQLRDADTYADLLARFYGFYLPAEAALANVSGYDAVGIDFEARRKSHLLRQDLAAVGRDPEAVPLSSDLPAVRSLGQALGWLYVFEGATLGGRVVSRMARERLGVTPESGGSFFASYGDRVGEMWAAFRAALVRHATTPRAEEEVVSAAGDAFDRFGLWLAPAAGVKP